ARQHGIVLESFAHLLSEQLRVLRAQRTLEVRQCGVDPRIQVLFTVDLPAGQPLQIVILGDALAGLGRVVRDRERTFRLARCGGSPWFGGSTRTTYSVDTHDLVRV